MTNISSATRRYLALWFPFLPADRLRIQELGQDHSDRPPDAPLVLTGKQRGALVLRAVDARAQALGLVPGLTLADARARLPGLQVAEMDEAADQHWLGQLAHQCLRWTPLVEPRRPDAIVLDIAGCSHLFGGEAALIMQVDDHLSAQGMTLRLATATTAEAALALARFAPLPIEDEYTAVRALPVAALALNAEAALALKRAGLNTIGAVAARPSAAIAARFGMAAVQALRRLLGDEHMPLDPLAQPEPLHFERRFAEPIGHQAAVAACFLDLLREAAGALEARGLGGRRFSLTLFRCDGARRNLGIETGLPTRDPAMVLRLFDERIAALADPLDPGFGYDRITLFLPRTEALAAVQPRLDGSAEVDAVLAALLDRLATRLGAGAIRRLVPQDSHIPEQAQLALPASQLRAPVPWPDPPQNEVPLRPLFLFDPPQQVEVIAEVPDGPPHRFRWRRNLHEVRLYEGPERIASEWWRHKGGEHPGKGGLTRDYYRVEDVRGRRYWIFRHGLYAEKPDPRWYLHGLFA